MLQLRAPVDIQHSSACAYCHTPISILDPNAITKAIGALTTAQSRRGTVDVNLLADALLQRSPSEVDSAVAGAPLVDLIAVGVGIVAALLR